MKDTPSFFLVYEAFCPQVVANLPPPFLLMVLRRRSTQQEKDAQIIVKQLLSAVAFMHEKNVTHRDLKLENLLLARPNDISSVVIADFGLAFISNNARQKLKTQCGTPSYVAPEILMRNPYTPAVDVWSLGVILYTLLIGSFPFAHKDQEIMYALVCKGRYETRVPEWDQISDDVKDLLKGLLAVDPTKRLTAADALQHKWFTTNEQSTSTNLKKSHTRLQGFADALKLPVKTFEPGDYILRQGEFGDELYLIKSGTCEVLVDPGDGADISRVATRGPGDLIGEIAVYNADVARRGGNRPRTASVRAIAPLTATVMSNSTIQSAADNDYTLDSEIQEVIKLRIMELRRNGQHRNTVETRDMSSAAKR